MSSLQYYHVDAFTTIKYKGNPAGIFIYNNNNNHLLTDEVKQKIAIEINLPISVFIRFNVNNDDELPFVQWFSPNTQIFLCGHGTLALAHIYFDILYKNKLEFSFNTVEAGIIKVTKQNNLYCINFPMILAEIMNNTNEISNDLLNGISKDKPINIYKANNCLVFEYENELTIINAQINVNELKKNKENRIIITSKTNNQLYKNFDFISRVYHAGIEDFVCGSAHCTLGPLWSNKLNKNDLIAFQASQRSGILNLIVNHENKSVTICGEAVTIASGTFYL